MALDDINPVWLAHSRLRRRRYEDCISLCTAALQKNPLDQVAWYLKCRAITLQAWIDDSDLEEQALGDLLMDEHNVAQAARPGTSFVRPSTQHNTTAGAASPSVRPMSAAGRPLTGFARPGTSSARPGTGKAGSNNPRTALTTALKAARPGTGAAGRPITSSGRYVRLGTASLASCGAAGGPFIKPERLDMRKYAARPNLARVLCDYIMYVDGNMRQALELAGHSVQQQAGDWWWRERQGKACYQLGLLREADQHFEAASQLQDMLVLTHQRTKVFMRMDQPLAALQLYSTAAQRHPGDVGLLLAQARIHEALGKRDQALALYNQVLVLNASSAEAIACLAAEHFYSDQPELAIRYYRRLLQVLMGEASAEVWNNLGLSCFYAGQYDLCFSCFERGLAQADDALLPDIWHNIGQVAIGIGQLAWAEQCFRLAAALDPNHGESLNNLGVLESRRGAVQQASVHFKAGMCGAHHVYETPYNAALLAHRQGNLQEALSQVNQALALYPQHNESLELKNVLKMQLNTV